MISTYSKLSEWGATLRSAYCAGLMLNGRCVHPLLCTFVFGTYHAVYDILIPAQFQLQGLAVTLEVL